MSDTDIQTGLFGRSLRRLSGVWRDMAATVQSTPGQTDADLIRACLSARGGEVSARAAAAKFAATYAGRDRAGRVRLLCALAAFDSDPGAVAAAYAAVQDAPDVAARAVATASLRRALDPPRAKLLVQLASIPDGVKFLVDMRALLLAERGGEKLLAALESDLRALLTAWFDVGFLELRRVDWTSPAALLERLAGYEAVHEIRSWRDLKDRLDSDRRCYAFFHPGMPAEPLIFVEVALTRGLADSVQSLLNQKAAPLDPREADAAIFYSISNCQAGLAGISFGNFLIKRVVALLGAEFRNLKTFATLSPIPGFRAWLDARLAAGDSSLLTPEETAAMRTISAVTEGEPLSAMLSRRGVLREPACRTALEPVLPRLAARYLLTEGAPRARDPVAHFHLSNGARVERLNFAGDTSAKGFRESAGMMVNYLYDPAQIDENHEAYAGEGRRQASSALRKLIRGYTPNGAAIEQRPAPDGANAK